MPADKTKLRVALKLCAGLVLVMAASVGVDWLLRVQNFPVRNVRFEGPFRHVTREELEAVVLPLVRGNFFLVDLDTIKQGVESIVWVHRAEVRRSFPSDVHVLFTEQQLAARWGDGDWVNTHGEVVRLPGAELPPDAPRFAGPEGSSARVLAAYREFTPALARGGLRIAALRLSPRHSWRLEIERDAPAGVRPSITRFALVLDGEQPRRRVERFARIYAAALVREAALLRQVDLRYTNGFSVEWRNTRAAATAGTALQGNEG